MTPCRKPWRRLWIACLYRTGEETRDELQKGMEVAKDDLLKTMEDIKEGIGKLTKAATETTNNINGTPTQYLDLGAHHASYVEALNHHLPPIHLSTLARKRVKEKQVLVDKEPTANTDPLQDLTKCKLVAKAN